MTVEPNDLLLFARVADAGSFSRAAVVAGLPKSTLSRRIAALEAQLGERLLLRTTRRLAVTDFGHGVLEHARQIAADVEAAAALAQHRQAEPSGRLRVSMPSDFGNVVLGQARRLRAFAARAGVDLQDAGHGGSSVGWFLNQSRWRTGAAEEHGMDNIVAPVER